MFETLEQALQILGLGWGGVFLAMLAIYLVSMLLTKLFPPAKE